MRDIRQRAYDKEVRVVALSRVLEFAIIAVTPDLSYIRHDRDGYMTSGCI